MMTRTRTTAGLCLGVCLLMMGEGTVGRAAPPPGASLLPNTTTGFVSTSDVQKFSAAWDRTQFGQLMDDPAMGPFIDDLKQQIRDKWSQSFLRLGVTWEDIEQVAGGETCSAVIWDHDRKKYPHELPASVFLVDVTGKDAEAKALLARVAKDLLQQKARYTKLAIGTTQVDIYDAPTRPKTNSGRYVYFLKDNLLCGCDNYEIMAAIVQRLAIKAAGGDSLANTTAYKHVTTRCAKDAGKLAPQAVWYTVPLDFMEARRILRDGPKPPRKKGDPIDNLTLLRDQGFGDIKGTGSFVNFEQGPHDILQRVSVYAPAPLRLAARMLDFPNASSAPPADWIPADIATCGSFHWNVPAAFEASKTMFDEFYGIKPADPSDTRPKRRQISIFEDSVRGLLDDPEGPKVDIRNKIIKHLGPQTYFLVDYVRPITPTSEERLFATQVTEAKTVAAEIEKLMKADPDVKAHMIGKHRVWEIPDDERVEDIEGLKPRVELDDDLKADDQKGRPLPGQSGGRLLARSWVTVAFDYLMISSSRSLVEKALNVDGKQKPLAQDRQFQQIESLIASESKQRQWDKVCYRRFSRTEREFESSYELMRQGEMPQSESFLAQLLNNNRSDPKDDEGRRKQRLDGSKMPPYDTARGYFTPSGWVGITEKDGWFLVHFMQRKGNGIAKSE
ncbi:MAG: hypothetical protein AB7O62_01710 [Pirellulales bacterium]